METYKIAMLWSLSVIGTGLGCFLWGENTAFKWHIRQEVRWLRKAVQPGLDAAPPENRW